MRNAGYNSKLPLEVATFLAQSCRKSPVLARVSPDQGVRGDQTPAPPTLAMRDTSTGSRVRVTSCAEGLEPGVTCQEAVVPPETGVKKARRALKSLSELRTVEQKNSRWQARGRPGGRQGF